jgi:hypothetical protein
LEDNISLPPNKNGTLALGLDSGMKYNIYAKGKDSAQALYANFDPSRERDAVLYCLPHKGGGVFPYEAPIITDISFGPGQRSPWTKLYGGDNHIAGPRTDVAYIRIAAMAKCSIIETAHGPRPITIDLDALACLPTNDNGWYMQTPTPRGFDGQVYYETICCFTVPGQEQEHSEKEHWLDIVVYDIANNRTERRVYLTFTDAAASIANDDDLSDAIPELYELQAQTGGGSSNIFAINPIDSYGGSCVVMLGLRVDTRVLRYGDVLNDARFLRLRGVEVYRSTDNAHFNKVNTIRFDYTYGRWFVVDDSSLDEYDWLLRQGLELWNGDVSHDLSEGTMYYYKIRAFNGNPANGGFSQFSNVLCTTPMPPFSLKMTSPEHGAISDKIYPTFAFDFSNPSLIGPELSDSLYFMLFLKNITGNDPFFQVRFMADFTDLDYEGNPLIWYVRYFEDGPNGPGSYWTQAVYDSGQTDNNGNPIMLPFAWIEGDTFVVDSDNEAFKTGYDVFDKLLPGAAYEWNIMDAWFYKEYPVTPGLPDFAYANAASVGADPNGLFTFSIDPDAK